MRVVELSSLSAQPPFALGQSGGQTAHTSRGSIFCVQKPDQNSHTRRKVRLLLEAHRKRHDISAEIVSSSKCSTGNSGQHRKIGAPASKPRVFGGGGGHGPGLATNNERGATERPPGPFFVARTLACVYK